MKTNRLLSFSFLALFCVCIVSCGKDDKEGDEDEPLGTDWATVQQDVTRAMNDVNFKAFCIANYDLNKDGKVSASEALAVDTMDISNKGISSLKGLEYFPRLVEFQCASNNLTSLDLSGCADLKALVCTLNELTSLDVSDCRKLEVLICPYNALKSIDVTSCTALKEFDCKANNQLLSINVSKCTALTDLYCTYTNITSLDLSKNTALEYLSCDHNQLTTLDLSKCPALYSLACTSNLLQSIDISKCTALGYLYCSSNLLTSLDLSGNANLIELNCSSNKLTSLDISNCLGFSEGGVICTDNKELTTLWLKTGQRIHSLAKDTTTIIRYKN